MKKKVTIYEIDGAFIVKYGDDVFRSYQVASTNNQIELMVQQVLSALDEKNYKVVSKDEAAKLALLERTYDRETQA